MARLYWVIYEGAQIGDIGNIVPYHLTYRTKYEKAIICEAEVEFDNQVNAPFCVIVVTLYG